MKCSTNRAEVIPFDAEAARYDDVFTESFVGKHARARFWRIADALLLPGMHALELGGGTGEDAAHFAGLGLRVCCTDASSEMLRAGKAKAAARGLKAFVEFHQLDMNQLAAGNATLPLEESTLFDAAYSNFGALNCVGDLSGLGRALAARLRPGAPLLLTVMGPHCPWEWLGYTVQGQPRTAFRRWRHGGVSWRGLSIYYPSVTALAKALAPDFRLCRAQVINACLPPSYLEPAFCRVPWALRTLEAMDAKLQTSATLVTLSDHYVAQFERLP